MNKLKVLHFLITLIAINDIKAQSWHSQEDYNVNAGGDGAISFSINGKIYAGGGINSKSFREYNPSNNQWTNKADIPGVTTSRAFGIGFSLNGMGYAGLGLDGTTPKNDLWEYDPVNNQWTQKSNYPGAARDGLFVFNIANLEFVGGGEDPFSLVQSNHCYSYAPVIDMWFPVADFPLTGIIYPFAFSINNNGYVSCGQESSEIVSTYEYFQQGNQWIPKADFPGAARQAGACFVLNDIAYCGLGMDMNNFYNDFFSYDAMNDQWNSSITLPAAGRSFCSAVSDGINGYAGLGWSFTSTSEYYKDWWKFDPAPTGINDIKSKDNLIIFPNPATDIISLASSKDLSEIKFEIINANGENVLAGSPDNKNQVDVSELNKGLYFILINSSDYNQQMKFIKE